MARKSNSLFIYILRHLLQAIPLILGIVIVNFFLVHLAPGDPIVALVGEFQVSPEYVASIRSGIRTG